MYSYPLLPQSARRATNTPVIRKDAALRELPHATNRNTMGGGGKNQRTGHLVVTINVHDTRSHQRTSQMQRCRTPPMTAINCETKIRSQLITSRRLIPTNSAPAAVLNYVGATDSCHSCVSRFDCRGTGLVGDLIPFTAAKTAPLYFQVRFPPKGRCSFF